MVVDDWVVGCRICEEQAGSGPQGPDCLFSASPASCSLNDSAHALSLSSLLCLETSIPAHDTFLARTHIPLHTFFSGCSVAHPTNSWPPSSFELPLNHAAQCSSQAVSTV